MKNNHLLRGMATVNFWADDVAAARDWYTELLGVEAYFQQPNAEHPAYVEFRIGDYEDEFGIINRNYAPKGTQPGLGGAVLYWHVDDIEGAVARLKALGAAGRWRVETSHNWTCSLRADDAAHPGLP